MRNKKLYSPEEIRTAFEETNMCVGSLEKLWQRYSRGDIKCGHKRVKGKIIERSINGVELTGLISNELMEYNKRVPRNLGDVFFDPMQIYRYQGLIQARALSLSKPDWYKLRKDLPWPLSAKIKLD